MKRISVIYFGLTIIVTIIFSNFAFAQSIFDYNGITYKVLKEADEASTFGTVAVTAKSDGFYEGIVVIPNAVKQSDDEYADAYKVVAIDDYAFKDSPTLTKVVLSRTIESVGTCAFQGCTQMTEIEIPEGALPDFKWMAFAFSGLKSIKLPEGMTVVPRLLFSNCKELEQVILPESLSKIDFNAFVFCKSLKTIELPSNLKRIEGGAFSGSGLTKVALPNNVIIIPEVAFSDCFNLEEITLSPSTTTIKGGAFSCCGKLSRINRPETLKVIEENALGYCLNIPKYYQSEVPDFPKTEEEKEIWERVLQEMKEAVWK